MPALEGRVCGLYISLMLSWCSARWADGRGNCVPATGLVGLPTGATTSCTLTSLNAPVSRSVDSSFPPILASPPLVSQYLITNSYAARTAGAFPSTSPVTDKSSTRSQPPGLTSRAMRSRARWGFGSCMGIIFFSEWIRWAVRHCTQAYVYQDEPHVDDVEGVRFEGQGLCQDIEL